MSTIDHSPRRAAATASCSPGSSTGCPPPPGGSRLRGCRLVRPSSASTPIRGPHRRPARHHKVTKTRRSLSLCVFACFVVQEDSRVIAQMSRRNTDTGPARDHREGHRDGRLQLRPELREAVPVFVAMLTEVLDDQARPRAAPRRSRTAARAARTCAPAAPPARPARRCRSPASPAMIRCG